MGVVSFEMLTGTQPYTGTASVIVRIRKTGTLLWQPAHQDANCNSRIGLPCSSERRTFYLPSTVGSITPYKDWPTCVPMGSGFAGVCIVRDAKRARIMAGIPVKRFVGRMQLGFIERQVAGK